MELSELTRTRNGKRTPDILDIDSSPGSTKSSKILFITYKYAPIICILEALLLVSFVVYLSLPNEPVELPNNNNAPPRNSPLPANSDAAILPSKESDYRTFSNGQNSSKILIGLVPGCNQRIHDHRAGVRCSSKDTNQCATLEDPIRPKAEPTTDDGLWFTIVTTSKSGKRMRSTLKKLRKISRCPPGDDHTFSCNNVKTKLKLFPATRQTIIGWGGALSDSSINNLLALTTNGTRRLLDDYFGSDGLKFNMIRVTIGGSDFSSRLYTNNDKLNQSSKDDVEMREFRLREEDLLYKIPMLKFIQNNYGAVIKEPIKIFASMWSPPTWMKTNNHFNKGYLKGSPARTPFATGNDKYYSALAELKKKFLLSYKDNDIDFWGLTVMNEPIMAIQPFLDFNTMIFPENDYANYISRYLGPVLKRDSRLSQIKLIVHDDNRRYLLNFTEQVLSSDKVMQFVDGVSVHGYIDQDYELMDDIYEKFRFKTKSKSANSFFVLPTELCSGHLPWMEKALIGNWHRGIHYALDIIHSLQHSAAGWVDWNMALDTRGGPGWLGGKLDSPIIVDKSEDAYYKNPMYYVLGQFSRYIPPGSERLSDRMTNANFDNHFETVSFLLPGREEIATVVLNNNPYPVSIVLALYTAQSGKADHYMLYCENDSITTFIYEPSTKF